VRNVSWGGVLGIVIGTNLAYSALRAPSGYAAAYAQGGAWVLAAVGLVIGGPMLLLRRTRQWGKAATAAGVALLLAFYAGFALGSRAGLRAWWGEESVPIPSGGPMGPE
jgi:hypothetical protein